MATADDDANATTLSREVPRDEVTDPQVTDEHADRYRVKAVVGAGTQGSVYVAVDTHLQREVAMKVPAADASPSALGRFLREARIAAQLEHPNIVPVYEIGRRSDGGLYCVQRLVRADKGSASTFRSALRAAQTLDERLKLLNAFVDVCHGVAYAHSRGVLHRDLKPENVVLGRFGETMVVDWGLARLDTARDPAESGALRMPPDGLSTMTGVAHGTPAYMSPEQARGDATLDPRTDIWSLGAMLFELLTARPPFLGPSAMETVALVAGDTPVPVAKRALREVPSELSAIAERALQRDPAERYASASELAADLIAWQNGRRVRVYDYGPLELLKLFVSRNRLASAVGLASLLAVFVAAGVALRNAEVARRALSMALLEKARDAERALQWDRAAQLYAEALAQDDNDETRWGVRLTGSRKPPPLERLVGQPGPARALAFSPDGRVLAVGASDGRVYLWDARARTKLGVLDVAHRDITGLSFSPDGAWLAVSSEEGSARVFAVDGWREEAPLIAPGKHAQNALAFSPRGDAIAVAGEDGSVRVLSWPGRQQLYVGSEPEERSKPPPVYTVAWSKKDGALAWGTWRGGIHVIDFASSPPTDRRLSAHFGSVLSLAFTPDGSELISAGRDGSVRVWDVARGAVVHSFEGHTQKVYAVRLDPTGAQVATGSTDRTLRIWQRLVRQSNVGASFNDGEDVQAIDYSPDGRLLVWAGTSGAVRLREVPPRAGFAGDGSGGRTYVVEQSPDGRWLLTSQGFGFDVFDTKTHAKVATLPGSQGAAFDAVFIGNDRVLWTCSNTEVCTGPRDGTGAVQRFPVPDHPVSVEAAADGAWVVIGMTNGLIRWIDPKTGATLADSRLHSNVVYDFSLSPDGKLLASASYDKTVRLWSVADRSEVATLKGHTHGVRRVAFSPDGATLATASWDTTMRLWDVATRTQRAVGAQHEDHVFALGWAPTSKWLATGAWDGTVRIWDAADASELGRAVADVDRVQGLCIDRAGTGIWYAGWDVHRLDFSDSADR